MAQGQEQHAVIAGSGEPLSATAGIVLHSPVFYDFTVWLAMLGKERAFRENVVRLARLEAGESVLDVGCGTGTLAIAAKRRVGPTGTVSGRDASPEMLARAEKKTKKAGLDIVFKNGLAEKMPFPDAQFHAVLNTVMLHHLPRKARLQCVREIRRVVRPDGRVLIVDFDGSARQHKGLVSHFYHGHGHFVLAKPPCCG